MLIMIVKTMLCSEKNTLYIFFYISVENVQIFIKFSGNV